MIDELSLSARVLLAFAAFFRVLFDGRFAAKVRALEAGAKAMSTPTASAPAPAPTPAPASAPTPAVAPATPALAEAQVVALHLFAGLQREGRLIDFVQEDLAGYSDAEVGAAARVVHEGCKKMLKGLMIPEPILPQADGANVEVAGRFDDAAIRLTGNVVGQPPFKGVLKHHGWRATKVGSLSRPSSGDPHILAPAEVELP